MITEWAILIPAMISWPDIIQEQLWPVALHLDVDLHNCTPGPSGQARIYRCQKMQPSTRFLSFWLHSFCTWPHSKASHSLVGVYLGLSPDHTTSIPCVLCTSSCLVSPQFHVVFDGYFTTTKYVQTNLLLPSNWPTSLSTSSVTFIDDGIDPSNFIDSSWFFDSPSSQRGALTCWIYSTTTFTPSQRESITGSTSPLQREPDNGFSLFSSTPPPHSGWNQNHHYSTRFKQHHLANIATIDTTSSIDTPFDESLYAAFIAVQDSFPITSSTEHYACGSHTNSDILQYSTMLCDPDRASFEVDMKW